MLRADPLPVGGTGGPHGSSGGALPASFDRIDLSGRGTVVVAVSGGSDSTALLLLASRFLARHAPAIALLAVTVDHGLRPGSAAEAAGVASFCRARDIAHRTVAWTGGKPASGLSEAARLARYALLAAAAGEAGTDIVLLGHTLDDNIETVAMRRLRGEGRGLAGMAPATLYDGRVWFLRPLLACRRTALRQLLLDEGVSWHDDPTNANPAFERARTRAALAGEGAAAPSPAAIAAAASDRRRLDAESAALIDRHAARIAPGLYRLDRAFAQAPAAGAAVHVFRVLLAVAGGREHLPDMDRAAALLARLCRGSLCATLSRAMVIGRRDGLWLCREARGLPAPLAPAAGMIWDGRFRIEGWPVPPGTTLAPRGRGEALRDGKTAPGGAPARLAATARAAEPALWRDGALLGGLAGNGLESLSAVPVVGPWARFLPSFDLASAGAAAALAGAPPFPAPPCLDGGPEPA